MAKNHETPDTNLIQKGVIVTKKRNEKYLKLDASGIWHLNFRVPEGADMSAEESLKSLLIRNKKEKV